MAPLEPSLTTTRLGIVTPPTQFRSELPGRGPPSGQTDRQLGAVVSVAVTLSTTAPAPLSGTSPRPPTWRLITPPGPTVRAAPVPSRVSSSRAGVSGA